MVSAKTFLRDCVTCKNLLDVSKLFFRFFQSNEGIRLIIHIHKLQAVSIKGFIIRGVGRCFGKWGSKGMYFVLYKCSCEKSPC